MIASVLAMTCSSSATSTLGFDVTAVVESAMLNVPKFEDKSLVLNETFASAGLSCALHNNDTLSAGLVDGPTSTIHRNAQVLHQFLCSQPSYAPNRSRNTMRSRAKTVFR